ncbi:ribonuclease HII [Candidatus Woesearchaeota archaeon]|nr:ribonuclease HII [Candidatus Woesearchaeota archaeon]
MSVVTTKIICGIDEAGRGPVIGPMVMAGVLFKEEDIIKLERMGVKDSKLLTPKQRNGFFNKIKDMAVSFSIKIIKPSVVDEALKDPELNLNWLEAINSAEIVNELKPDKVIIDCPSNNIPAYQNYLLNKFNEELKEIEMVVEHKADLNHLVVAAASVLAKVVRDTEIEKLKKKFKIEFGSGYLSDGRTQIFMKHNFDNEEYSGIFRKMWKPYQKLVDIKGQKTLGGF